MSSTKPILGKTFFSQVLDSTSRANPYPLYTSLRATPVCRDADGTYIVSTHAEIRALLHDPRLSSEDLPKPRHPKTGNPFMDFIINPIGDRIIEKHRPLVFRDPPDHTVLRRQILSQFTMERVQSLSGRIQEIIADLIGKMRGREEIDIVDDFAYPLPVTVICELLGVPPSDESKLHNWSMSLLGALEPDRRLEQEETLRSVADYEALSSYMNKLIKEKRKRPSDDILSGLASQRDKKLGRMGKYDLLATAVLLLVAGHETTVNLIANAILTLLRHPEWLDRLRADESLAPRIIEEVLRFEPPVHFRTRKALADIEIGGTVIPEGAPVILLFASGNRDPKRFADPDRFDPGRTNNQHFGFGGGAHACIGAPLAKLEAGTAITALARSLIDPRLLVDPPPYRPGASLRGPEHLRLHIAGIA